MVEMDTVPDGLFDDVLLVVVGADRATLYRHLDDLDGDRSLMEAGGWEPEEVVVAADDAGVPVVDTRSSDGEMFGLNPPRPAHHPAQVEATESAGGAVVSPAAFVRWAADHGADVRNPSAAPDWETA